MQIHCVPRKSLSACFSLSWRRLLAAESTPAIQLPSGRPGGSTSLPLSLVPRRTSGLVYIMLIGLGSAASTILFLVSYVNVNKAGRTITQRLGLCVDLTHRRRTVRGENETGMRILCPAEAVILWVIIETAAPNQTWRIRNCALKKLSLEPMLSNQYDCAEERKAIWHADISLQEAAL